MSTLAVEIESLLYRHTDRLRDRVDEALSPVRECLEGLKQHDLLSGPCWCGSSMPNSFLEDPAKWKHSDACLAAQQLYERLKIQ